MTRTALATLLALALSACSSESSDGFVSTLEPRLAKPPKPTAEIACIVRVEEELRLGPELDRWRPVGCEIASPSDDPRVSAIWKEGGFEGVFVKPLVGASGPPPAILIEGLDVDAQAVSSVVLRAASVSYGDARLWFRTSADELPGAGFPPVNMVEIQVRPSARPSEWSFPVTDHPRWQGRIQALRIQPTVTHTDPFLLQDLRFVDQELEPGPSPTIRDGDRVDAGLVRLVHVGPRGPRYEARRAYPALAGLPQLAGGPSPSSVLQFAYALPPRARRLEGPVTFRVSVEDGEVLFENTLDPASDEGRWFVEEVEVPELDESASLEFLTEGGRPEARVNGLWASLHQRPTSVGEDLPNVILITADTLRADHVGIYGADDADTPVVDELGRRGSVFLDTMVSSNATSPSHATIHTGLYPKDHRVQGNQHLIPEKIVTLAELMRSSGRLTLGSSAVRHLNARHSGLGQGMDVYLDTPPPAEDGVSRAGYRGAPEIHRSLLDVLDGVGEMPFFAWLHYYDPHTPYVPEQAFRERFWEDGAADGPLLVDRLAREWAAASKDAAVRALAEGGASELQLRERFFNAHPDLRFLGEARSEEEMRAMYRAEIAQLDEDIDEVFDRLRASGRMEDTIVVFTSDHGEALGERDIWFSHQGVYDNTLRVPLIFHGPGVPSGVLSDAPVESVDIVPTICELLDLPLGGPVRGRSLVGLMNGEEQGPRTRWFQYTLDQEAGFQAPDTHYLLSLTNHQRGTFGHSVPAGVHELYDRTDDPGLTRDLSEERADHADKAAERVREWLEDKLQRTLSAQRAVLDEADRAALEELGYTGD